MLRYWIVTCLMACTIFAALGNAQNCKTTEADKTAVVDTLPHNVRRGHRR